MNNFLKEFASFLIFVSPVLFIIGLIITASNKGNRKLGLALVIGSVISFIIGFGICANNLRI